MCIYSVIDDPTIQSIAKKLNVDAAQMLISWAVQRGTVVLPKSVTPTRIESNFKGENRDSVLGNFEINSNK
jgi:diketogulonate reductase-like aldo/keto reductase